MGNLRTVTMGNRENSEDRGAREERESEREWEVRTGRARTDEQGRRTIRVLPEVQEIARVGGDGGRR